MTAFELIIGNIIIVVFIVMIYSRIRIIQQSNISGRRKILSAILWFVPLSKRNNDVNSVKTANRLLYSVILLFIAYILIENLFN